MLDTPTVLLITEGTYPYQEGGVSTWCHALISQMPDVSFTVVGITGQPQHTPALGLPPNARVTPVPLWGTLGAGECRHDLAWWERRRMRLSAARPETLSRFGELFALLLADLLADEVNVQRLSLTMRDLARLFLSSDYDALMRHKVAWRTFREQIDRRTVAWPRSGEGLYPTASLRDLSEALQMLTRWLTPLAIPLPRSTIVHATTAGLSSLPAIVARAEYGTPFLLTEHGVYLRERLLAWTASEATPFLKWFAMRVTRRIVELSLGTADVIAPVSGWNGRWEQHLGVSRSRIGPILNGADPNRFAPQPMPAWDTPTMVWVGRIDPLKDLLTLIEATALIRRELPTARTLLYGRAPAGNEAYEQACRTRVAELDLEGSLLFQGYSESPQGAFAEGHISVLSSISEALPFSVLEAMLCGRPVVGTAVGGVPEVLAVGGKLVPPRSPEALAHACISLLADREGCEALGLRARAHALENFTLDQCIAAYNGLYRRLSGLLLPPRRPWFPGNAGSNGRGGAAVEGFAD
jgi:glycosyltransferase involved in cell wall biosynthesis